MESETLQPNDAPSQNAPDVGPASVQMPEFFQRPFEDKDEDRIKGCNPNNCGAVIVVADGASETELSSGGALSGAGRQAAEVACDTAFARLKGDLDRELHVDEILKNHHIMFSECAAALRGCLGSTTLLTVMLRRSECRDGTNCWYWYYSYQGDGHIVLFNPLRAIDTKMLWTKLLPFPGQKLGRTATLSAKGSAVPPIIGCVSYQRGDSVYIGSDGMDAAEGALRKRNAVIAHRLQECIDQLAGRPLQLSDAFGEFKYGDDAVLGVIVTH